MISLKQIWADRIFEDQCVVFLITPPEVLIIVNNLYILLV